MARASKPIPGDYSCGDLSKKRMTKSEAKSTAKRIQRLHGRLVDAYWCATCGGWHVGTRRKFVV